MSIKLMAEIFESDLPPTDRLVMLSLADHADENGRCYPSISRLCERTGVKERAVQGALKRLREAGYISVDYNAGKRGANVYSVRSTPAPDAPRRRCTPAADAPDPRSSCGGTPAADAPDPSSNHQEPPEVPPVAPPAAKSPVKARLPEEWTPTDEDREYALSLKLTDAEIQEIADDFHAYWTDRTDSGGRKSQRGWRQTWRNRCRDVAPKFIRNRGLVGGQRTGGFGQGGSIASVVARRHIGG